MSKISSGTVRVLERRRREDNLWHLDEHPGYHHEHETERERLPSTPAPPALADSVVLMTAVPAYVAVFPQHLKLKHGPLLAVIETWSDGVVAARWAEGRLYGEGACDADAIRALVDNIADCLADLNAAQKTHRLAGAAMEQWMALKAIFAMTDDDLE